MKKGKFDKAQKKFESALKARTDFAEAHNNLAYCLRQQGEEHYQAALEHYNQAISLDAELAEAYMYRGSLYLLLGEKEKAQADHATLLKLHPALAKELATVLETGKEKDVNELYGVVIELDG